MKSKRNNKKKERKEKKKKEKRKKGKNKGKKKSIYGNLKHPLRMHMNNMASANLLSN